MDVLSFVEYIISFFSSFFKKNSNDKELISKIYFELIYYSELHSSNYKETIEIFNKVLSENTVLSRPEKELLRDRVSRNIEREKELFKRGEPFECSHCKLTRYSTRYCENCIIQYLKSLLGTWASGSEAIDEFIRECQSKSALPLHIIEWISFDQFEDVEYLADGGFAKIYTAKWKRGAILDWNESKQEFIYQGSHKVVLKSLNNSKQPTKEFFDEAKALVNVRSGDIVNAYGITKFPQDGNYAIVMNYFGEGNLRSYLEKNHETMSLKEKVFAIWRICFALSDIHAQDLRCWNGDPSKRPTIEEILDVIKYQYRQILENEELSIAYDNEKKTYSGSRKANKPTNQTYHTSRILSLSEKDINKFVIPEDFDDENVDWE
ncbi:unnamed protein product [Rhizophagus irregularis]|nr:unnamed protein product [Rhizophagus irregularis]